MSTREMQLRLIENLREWQKIETAQIGLIGGVLEDSSNPVVSVIMEIIQRDSQMHHRVQQLLIDSLESRVVSLETEDVELIRDKLATHLAMEEETVRLAEQSLTALSGQELRLQEYLMDFLRRDEEKHRDMLKGLEEALGPRAEAE
jgi:hypothetical protein